MEHPAFADAGQKPGLEIWIIHNFEPVLIQSTMHGKFYNGDSYIVLKTDESRSSLTYNAHFWLGSRSTQDEIGAAAILTVSLTDTLAGRAVQHREVQGHESTMFLGYFKPAIRYIEGGLDSGFNQVETNAGVERRLLKLSGSDNMRIQEVPAEFSSLTRDNCFIFEQDHDIFVLVPQGSKYNHRMKVINVATKIRDDEHNGRGTIEIIDEFSDRDEIAKFLEAFGTDTIDNLAESAESEISNRMGTMVYLFKVLDGADLELQAVKKPYRQTNLSSEDVFILDTPDSGIFIWIGKAVRTTIKVNYNDIVQKYLDLKSYPHWVHVTRVSEGAESSYFKQYFNSWDVNLSNASFTASNTFAARSHGDRDVIKDIGKRAAISNYTPDDGSGSMQVLRFVSGAEDDVTERFTGEASVFFQTDVYVVVYKYVNENGEGCVLYVWVGKNSDANDKQAAVEFVERQEDELECTVTSIIGPQGKEPKHLLSAFKGHLFILMGEGELDLANNPGLFKIEGTEMGVDMKVTQVETSSSSLEVDDVFILVTKEKAILWIGQESDDDEQNAAMEFVAALAKEGQEIITLRQGEETEEFLDILGPIPEDKFEAVNWQTSANRRVNAERILTAVNVKMSGKIEFEELPSYDQEALSEDGVYILDTGEELYYWRGKMIPERLKPKQKQIIEEYIDDDGLDRDVTNTLVISIKQQQEPDAFKQLFPSWDDDMWMNQTSYEDIKNQLKGSA